MSIVVHSFWHGACLSELERSCFRSWSRNGYEHWLWAYEDVGEVPSSTTIKSANSLLDRSEIFYYQAGDYGLGSISGFSNFFRYKVLKEHGGIWADSDMYCLKPLPDQPYLFAKEKEKVATCVFAAPRDSPLMEACWDHCTQFDVATLKWAESGPILLTKLVKQYGLAGYCRPESEFFPVLWDEVDQLMQLPALDIADCYGVHFWHQQLHESGYDKTKHYPGSTFEKLIHNETQTGNVS